MLAADATLDELLSAQRVDITFANTIPDKVIAKLATIDGISSDDITTNSETNTIEIQCTHATQIARAAMQQAREDEWDIQALAPITPSLESVFRSLMYAHADRKASEEGAA